MPVKGAKWSRWTEAEKKFVKDNHGKMTDQDMVEVFARVGRKVSIWAIRELRYKMKLYKVIFGRGKKLVDHDVEGDRAWRQTRNRGRGLRFWERLLERVTVAVEPETTDLLE